MHEDVIDWGVQCTTLGLAGTVRASTWPLMQSMLCTPRVGWPTLSTLWLGLSTKEFRVCSSENVMMDGEEANANNSLQVYADP